MATFKVILDRIDTIAKQAEIMVEAASAAEALQQIAYDLDSDPGAYDSDLQPIEEGVGEMRVTTAMDAQNDNHAPARKFG